MNYNIMLAILVSLVSATSHAWKVTDPNTYFYSFTTDALTDPKAERVVAPADPAKIGPTCSLLNTPLLVQTRGRPASFLGESFAFFSISENRPQGCPTHAILLLQHHGYRLLQQRYQNNPSWDLLRGPTNLGRRLACPSHLCKPGTNEILDHLVLTEKSPNRLRVHHITFFENGYAAYTTQSACSLGLLRKTSTQEACSGASQQPPDAILIEFNPDKYRYEMDRWFEFVSNPQAAL